MAHWPHDRRWTQAAGKRVRGDLLPVGARVLDCEGNILRLLRFQEAMPGIGLPIFTDAAGKEHPYAACAEFVLLEEESP